MEAAGDERDEDCPPPPQFAGARVREMHIVNRKGLHARATAKLVQCVDRFEAEIKVTAAGETVGGDSIMGILTAGRRHGHDDHRLRFGRASRGGAGRHRRPRGQPLWRGRIAAPARDFAQRAASALHPEVFAQIESPHVGMGDDLVRRAFGQDVAAMDNISAVDKAKRLAHVVIGD